MKFKFLIIFSLLLFACQNSDDVSLEDSSYKEMPVKQPIYMDIGDTSRKVSISNSDDLLKTSEKRDVSIFMAEYITTGDNGEMGNTIFFGADDKGNKQLSADFAPGTSLDGSDAISYYVDENRPSEDLDAAITTGAIDRAMGTWDEIACSNLGMNKIAYDGRPTGFVSLLLGFGGSFDYVADVNHAGWMPAAFFDFLAPGGSNFILGVTFTLTFTGTDIVAAREIYYNEAFQWNDGATYDVETIALHEAGHGLSQAHFGKAFGNKGGVHFAPRAVMNAAYSGVQTSIGKTDNGGHCSNWGQWPNN